jgi:Sec-independent protein translocase protein TatA
MPAGVTTNELLLVALLVVIVALAPKVPRIGEAVGSWFEKREP